MEDEYIIISKTAIQKRIEELESACIELFNLVHDSEGRIEYKIRANDLYDVAQHKEIKSIPLIPEIEKHSIEFTKNLLNCTVSEAKSIDNIKKYHPKEYQLLLGELELNGKKIFEDYISNLKLDI